MFSQDLRIAGFDPDLALAIEQENRRQEEHIELIASENYASPRVLEAQGSVLTNKYAEGYPGKRYYGGCEFVDVAEQLAIDRVKQLFGAGYANVQPHSGSQANAAAYFALIKPGDTILGMSLAHGGHLTHGAAPNISGKAFNAVQYGIDPETGIIDYDQAERLAHEHKPKLVIAGFSAYSGIVDWARFRAIADSVGAYLLVDMAHVAGLVAAGELPSPVPHADVVTFTTYKTMLGPHGGVIVSTAEHAKAIDRAIFPGTQGAPDFGHIAAKAACFGIAAGEEFRATQRRIRSNAQALAASLQQRGDRLVSGGTDNHMVLVDLRGRRLTGDVAEVLLEDAGVLTNRNVIPFDPGTPDRPSGLRLGTTSCAQRGMGEPEMAEIASMIDDVLRGGEAAPGATRAMAEALARRFPMS